MPNKISVKSYMKKKIYKQIENLFSVYVYYKIEKFSLSLFLEQDWGNINEKFIQIVLKFTGACKFVQSLCRFFFFNNSHIDLIYFQLRFILAIAFENHYLDATWMQTLTGCTTFVITSL